VSEVPPDPDFPPQRYTAQYQIGFETDREYLGLTQEAWHSVYGAVENFILCDPYLASWEIDDSGGCRFLVTTDVPFLDVPRLAVYFKPDDESRVVTFLTVQEVPEAPDYVSSDE
jgi:hypothetical protein